MGITNSQQLLSSNNNANELQDGSLSHVYSSSQELLMPPAPPHTYQYTHLNTCSDDLQEYYQSSNNSYLQPQQLPLSTSFSLQPTTNNQLTNNQLGELISKKFDHLSSLLLSHNKRIIKNATSINALQASVARLEELSLNQQQDSSSLLQNVLKEIEERKQKSTNIIVYNLPEYNKPTPSDQELKKEFYKDLSRYNSEILLDLCKTLDPTLDQPVYNKRIGKFQIDKIRPILISFKNPSSVNSLMKMIPSLAKSEKFKSVIIRRDLTQLQRHSFQALRQQSIDLNSKNTYPNSCWIVVNKYTNPKIIKTTKNT